jgi:hypothetical protein
MSMKKQFKKRKFQYIINSEMVYLDEPLFFYSWSYGRGHRFEGFLTETEFDKKRTNDFQDYTNIIKRRISEGYLWELIEVQKGWIEFWVKKDRLE